MRILLSGATGLIGSAVYRSLIADHEVIRIGRTTGQYDVFFDIAAVSGTSFPACDALIHCAGVIDEDFRVAPMARLAALIVGADSLIRAAADAGAGRAIYISSSHVYGHQEGAINESCSANPLSHYAIAHYCTEQLIKKAFSENGQPTLILRPNAVYGPLSDFSRFKRWALIPFSFPLEAWANSRISLRSSGAQRRNFVSSATIGSLISDWLLSATTKRLEIRHPIGKISESVFEFANRCNRVASAMTGRKYLVIRPNAAPLATMPFEYKSLLPTLESDYALDNHIKALLGLFTAHPAWAKEAALSLSA